MVRSGVIDLPHRASLFRVGSRCDVDVPSLDGGRSLGFPSLQFSRTINMGWP